MSEFSFIGLIIAALVMGLMGSPHCLGMCGGLVFAFEQGIKNPARRSLYVAGFHAGRILTYVILGLLVFTLGRALLPSGSASMAGLSWIRILAGVALIISGLVVWGKLSPLWLERAGGKFWSKLAPIRTKMLPVDSFPKALGLGLVWGLLPCGLVYAAIALSLAASSAAHAAITMAAFGLGMVPMLVLSAAAAAALKNRLKKTYGRELTALVLILSGAVTLAAPLVMQRMHGDHGMHSDHGMHVDQSGHEVQGAHADHTDHAGMDMDMDMDMGMGMDHDQAADHSMMSHGAADHEMGSHMDSNETYPDMPMSNSADSAGHKPMEPGLNQGAVHFDQTSPAEPLSDPLDQIDQDAAPSFDQMSPESAAP